MTEGEAREIVIALSNSAGCQEFDLLTLANVLTTELPALHGKVGGESLAAVTGVAATLLSMWIKQINPSLEIDPADHLPVH